METDVNRCETIHKSNGNIPAPAMAVYGTAMTVYGTLCRKVRTIDKDGLDLMRRPGGNASDMLVASAAAPVKAKCMFVLVGREIR